MPESLVRREDWERLSGRVVQLRKGRKKIRSGVVDAVMDDGSALWLAQEGVFGRVLIEKAEDYEIWADRSKESTESGKHQ